MHVLVFGASGRTGRPLCESLLASGHTVRSLGRTDPGIAGVAHLAGDPTRPEDLQKALDGIDAVASALASSNSNTVCSDTAETLIHAAAGAPLRYLTIAGAAVDSPGDAKGVPDKIIGGIMKLVAGRMLADRQREHDLLRASPLAWTMLRPPRLTTAEPTGQFVLTYDKPATTQIPRGDLAAAMVACLADPATERRAPFVAAAP